MIGPRGLPGRLIVVCLCFTLLDARASAAATKGDTPSAAPAPKGEAARRMTMPEGFSATLFAGEPDVVQPIAFTTDDRGRLWVVEGLSYPKWHKEGATGNDRVVILEDTNG